MSEENVNRTVDELTLEQWLQVRKEEGRKIDPDIAEVTWAYTDTLDPFCGHPHPPEEYQCVGRVHFARSPGRDIWVSFCDLPDETRELLWERLCEDCRFPPGFSNR